MSDSEDPLDAVDEGGEDLFGDEGDDEAASPAARVLTDDDLASDPDEDPDARHRDYDDALPQETRDKVVIEQPTYRHRVPKPRDGMLRLLRVPKFIKFMPEVYEPDLFEPSEFDLANAKAEQPRCVARVQRDSSTGILRSNTNVYRWSDGSVTISVGGEHYEIQKKLLASGPDKPYNELHDGHCYAAAAELGSNMLMTVGHLKEQYNVKPNKAVGDDALTLFAERMAQASQAMKGEDMIVRTTRDPELQKRQAELAEKERMKAQRRRENAAAKMDGGLGRSGRGGLSIGDLEGERRGVGAGRKRGAPGSTKPKRRRPEYDSDDDLPQGVGRHEDYDMDDGFLVASEDEEMESGADGDEEEEEELLGFAKDGGRRSKRQRTTEAEGDEDAEGDEVELAGDTAGRARRRNVVDDEDEEE
ncbi:leo1-like protein [Hirsutella rhossiliensis]|uniref:Leo1-like protein n=1 Tax=Hirsutella rhossiliensis TaxID=111463 RepID=A0A9P8MTD8_9HYPO|nr:leo1-like protein [Hirsutella rhossiliensis]KAH0960940.1 leo1-like protein [Hirsutella rhossiliensis]